MSPLTRSTSFLAQQRQSNSRGIGTQSYYLLSLKPTRVGSPKLRTARAVTQFLQGGEWIIAVVNQNPVWGWMGRGLNLNDPGSSPSFSSTIVVQLGPRMFGIHSSIFPPDFSELTVSTDFFNGVLPCRQGVRLLSSSHFHSRQSSNHNNNAGCKSDTIYVCADIVFILIGVLVEVIVYGKLLSERIRQFLNCRFCPTQPLGGKQPTLVYTLFLLVKDDMPRE